MILFLFMFLIIHVKSSRNLGNEISVLKSRDTIITKNNCRRNFKEICKDEEIEYGMKKIIKNYISIYYIKNIKN